MDMSDDTGKRQWFRNAHLGMFVHWGIYSAIGRGEWVLNRERIPLEEYRGFADQFTGSEFDADTWAELAESAEMRYLIFTAKHHDGFAMWDTQTTDFNSTRLGPKRDVVAELLEAFGKRGLKVGFFFSLADWMHPAYPTPYATDWPSEWNRDEDRLEILDYSKAQLRELTQNYGPVDVMWFDGAAPGSTAELWESQSLLDLCYASNPDMLVNNRLFLPGDFDALELHMNFADEGRPAETDYPLNDSWAWNPDDTHYKAPWQVWQRLLQSNGKGANLLLNMAPDGQGRVPVQEQDLLRSLGRRIRRTGYHANINGYGPENTTLAWMQGGMYTSTHNRLYVHLFLRHGDRADIGAVANRVKRVTLVEERRVLPFEQEENGRIRVTGLGEVDRDEMGWCLELELEGEPRSFGCGHADLNF